MEIPGYDELDPRRIGRELKKARNRRGLTQAEAAGLIDVGRTTMVAIEKGDRMVRPEELVTLARGYGRSVSDFVRKRPEIAEFRIRYRGPGRPEEELKEKIEEYEHEFEELCRDYLELEQIVGAPMERDYPPEYETDGLSPEHAAEEIAQRERNRLGLGTGPLGDFRSILEEKVGIRIFLLEMRPSTFSEMYHYDEEVGGCIAINVLHPPERRLWSLAHGYMHFLVHRYEPAAYVEDAYQRQPESEQLADAGALHLTMPSTEVRARYNKIMRTKDHPTPADLCILAHYFGVSVAAMARRLEGMKLIPRGTWDKLKRRGFKVREAQEQVGLERGTSSDEKLPFRYQYLALEALEGGEITEAQFARFLRLDRLEARDIAHSLREQAGDITDESVIDLDLSSL